MGFIIAMLLTGIPIGYATLILSILFGSGQNGFASFLGISGTGLNIVVTWLAATHWHIGIQSMIVGALAGSSYLILSGGIALYRCKIRFSFIRIQTEMFQVFRDILYIGAPVSGSFILLFGFLFSFNYLVSFYGANEIAGFGIAFRIQSFIILPAIAIGTAMAIHANKAIASQNFSHVHPILFVGLGLSAILYFIISVFTFLFQKNLVMLFTQDTNVIIPAIGYLNCVAPSYFSLGVVLVLMTALEQTGQGLRIMLINIIFYSLEIGISSIIGLNQESSTKLYLVISVMNWISAVYIIYEMDKHLVVTVK